MLRLAPDAGEQGSVQSCRVGTLDLARDVQAWRVAVVCATAGDGVRDTQDGVGHGV